MSRYADLDALEKELNERLTFLRERNGNYDQYTDGFDEAVDRVENFQTADAVVVTRCKDCKHLVNAIVNSNGFLICSVSDMVVTLDDFCSYGEPMEDVDNPPHT